MGKKKTEENLPDNKKAIDDVIPISRIIELRKRGNSYTEIGKILGCSKQNVELRLRPFKAEIEALESYKEQRADVLAVYQQKILNSLTDSDIKSIPPGSRLTGFGILYDKERLERGQSSENIAIDAVHESYQDNKARHDKAVARLAELKAMRDGKEVPEEPADDQDDQDPDDQQG